ncbi:MAG: protein of unknown function DUF418, partial [uncultured Solirubrobacteraceae bacterium]
DGFCRRQQRQRDPRGDPRAHRQPLRRANPGHPAVGDRRRRAQSAAAPAALPGDLSVVRRRRRAQSAAASARAFGL